MGSAIDALIYHSIEISTKPTAIDARRAGCRFGKGCSGHEPVRPNGPQFRDGCAVTGDHNRSARLHFAEHGCGLIAKLPLCDPSVHRVNVAHVALRSSRRRTFGKWGRSSAP
jgi:hypothetical protein